VALLYKKWHKYLQIKEQKISSNENFEELDMENFNINNNDKNNKNNNKEYHASYKKKNFKPNYEQREYPEGFFEQFYCNSK